MGTVSSRDGFVVESAPLSAMLRTFVDTWNRDRPCSAHRFQGEFARDAGQARWSGDYQAAEPADTGALLGAVSYLAQESGVSETTIKHLIGSGCRSEATRLSIADALVSALGQPQAFHDGTLEVKVRRGGKLVPADG